MEEDGVNSIETPSMRVKEFRSFRVFSALLKV